MKTTTRLATTKDTSDMAYYGTLMHEESQFAQYNYDQEKVKMFLDHIITTGLGIVILAEDENKNVIGAMAGMLYPHYFGNELQASDLFLFVIPQYRTGTTGARLMKHFEEEAIKRGASEVVLANSTGVEKDKVAKLFERSGYVHRGYVYTKNVKGGDVCASQQQ